MYLSITPRSEQAPTLASRAFKLLRRRSTLAAMDVHAIRKRKVAELIAAEGSKKAFALRIESDPNYFSQIYGPSGTRNIGDAMARKIEMVYKLPRGYLDQGEPGDLEEIIASLSAESKRAVADFLEFQLVRAGALDNPVTAARYHAFIARITRDMERRRLADDDPPADF